MKQTKRVSKTRKNKGRNGSGNKIANLLASADEITADERVMGMYRPLKLPVTLRLDADVLAWFKTAGRGYQTRINGVLRAMMLKEKKKNRRRGATAV
jgi:uncharacterized protein (DUF4415 family)